MDRQEQDRQLIEQFRAAGRGTEGDFPKRPLLLLTTTGARTDQQHTKPMMYIPDGDRLIVVASNAGAATEPDWCRNLRAHPTATVEVKGEEYTATARILDGAERDQLWDTIVAQYSFFADHQAQITRQISLVALERQAED
jgi:deazaflavin-dependent oxidoreductase (nitroreductase family)